jgi:hypothetical protein
LQDQISIVSGKHVFSELSEWSQREFGASLSAAVVAHEIQSPEIVDEMLLGMIVIRLAGRVTNDRA